MKSFNEWVVNRNATGWLTPKGDFLQATGIDGGHWDVIEKLVFPNDSKLQNGPVKEKDVTASNRINMSNTAIKHGYIWMKKDREYVTFCLRHDLLAKLKRWLRTNPLPKIKYFIIELVSDDIKKITRRYEEENPFYK